MDGQSDGQPSVIESFLHLAESVGSSGGLSDDEVRRVVQWVRDNQQERHRDIQAFVSLVKSVMADRKVTTVERDQLYTALRQFQVKYKSVMAHSTDESPRRDSAKDSPPATDRQKEYASELGIQFPADITRRAISDLIDAAVAKRDEERFARLDALEARERAARNELREEILAELDNEDCRLSKASAQQMVDELATRGVGAILVTFKLDDVDSFDDLVGVNFSLLHCEDEITEREMKLVLSCVGVAMLRQLTVQPGDKQK